MAMTAKKKAALRARQLTVPTVPVETPKQCTCLVAIRGRGQHSIDCALYYE